MVCVVTLSAREDIIHLQCVVKYSSCYRSVHFHIVVFGAASDFEL